LIQLKGDLLEQTDSQLDRGDLIGPNPRAWAHASLVLDSVGVHNRSVAEPLVEGLVGKSAAADLFLTAEEMKDLPSPDKILAMDAKEFGKIVPKTIPSLYGLTYSLVAYASDVLEIRKAIKFLDITVERAKDLPAADCMSLGMELLMEKAIRLRIDNQVMESKEFLDNYDKVKDVYSVSSNGKNK
jgi:hypothetical protein